MSDHGKNVEKVIKPGFWMDTDGEWHFDGAEVCRAHGIPVTHENVEMLESVFKQRVRELAPKTIMVDEFGKP